MRESRLERKLCELGISPDVSASLNRKLVFRLYFPRPPYDGVEYKAARAKDGSYNFVGLVLGQGGSTLQRIQRSTGTKIEIHDSEGNLNGSPPDAGDASLHAVILADTQAKLCKASNALKELLQPASVQFKHFDVKAGGIAVLEPVVLMDEDSELAKVASIETPSNSSQPMQCASFPASPARSQQSDGTVSHQRVLDAGSNQVLMDDSLLESNAQQQQPSAERSKPTATSENTDCQTGWSSWKYDSACLYNSLTQATQTSISQIAEQSQQFHKLSNGHTYIRQGFDPLSGFQLAPLFTEIGNVAFSSGYTSMHSDSGSECSTVCNVAALDLHLGSSVLGLSSPQHSAGWAESDFETEDNAHVVEELLEMLKVPLY